jgi:hypothetical protein
MAARNLLNGYDAATLLELTGSAKARKTKNELVEKRGGRGEERRKDLERAEGLSKEWNLLALLRRGLMLWKKSDGIKQIMKPLL